MTTRDEYSRADRRYHSAVERIAQRLEGAAEEIRSSRVQSRTAGALDDLLVYTDDAANVANIVKQAVANMPLSQLIEYAGEADISLRLGL